MNLSSGCTYTFTDPYLLDNNGHGSNALPIITGKVTINGNGATIARSSTPSQAFRLLQVDLSPSSLVVNSVTLSNGAAEVYAPSPTTTAGGGAILNRGRLTVNGVVFNGNSATDINSTGGGAIDNHDSGVLIVTGSTFSNNSANEGGAVIDDANGAGSHVTISHSTFDGNFSTPYDGGAVENVVGTNDSLVADTFVNNQANGQHAIESKGAMTIDDSTITDSTGLGTDGGAIQNTGQLMITRSTISGSTQQFDANIHTYYPRTDASCTLTNGQSTMTDSNAVTTDVGSVVRSATPGIPANTVITAVNTSTHVVTLSAAYTGTTTSTANVYVGSALTKVGMTIVAGGGVGGGSNCGGTDLPTDLGYNIDDAASCSFSTASSLNNTNPLLLALASNAPGPTQTMALQPGSPAIDAIPTTVTGCPGTPGTDQRGVSRPQGSACDIGAYEVVNTCDGQALAPPIGAGDPPAAAGDSSGNEVTVWKGTAGNLCEASWNGSSWHGPADLGMGPLGSPPAVAIQATGEVDVFWKGTDGNLWEASNAGSGWMGPRGLGMGPLGSAPTATSWGSEVDVFWEGTDRNLWEAWLSGGTWHGPADLGMGPLGSQPTAAAHTNGEQDVFWAGTNGGLWEGFYSGGWHGPFGLGMGPLGSQPSATVLSSDEEDVVWRGTDANLWLATWSGGWSGPSSPGMGPLGSPPVAAALGTETDAFWQGTDRNLWEGFRSGSTWNGPVNLGMRPLG